MGPLSQCRLFYRLLISCYCISLNHADAQDNYIVGTPTSATVCDGRTVTLTCNISQSRGVTPNWRVFNTSDTSGTPVASLNSGDSRPPYNYPTVQDGDDVARLEVTASSSINGYHFQCRLSTLTPVDSPGTGTITVRDYVSCQATGEIPTIANFTEMSTTTSITRIFTTTFSDTAAGVIPRVQLPIILVLFCLVALFLQFW